MEGLNGRARAAWRWLGEESREPLVLRGRGALLLAAGLAIGMAVGWEQAHAPPWLWIAPGLGAACAAVVMRRRGRLAAAMLAVSMLCLGAAWVIVKRHRIEPDDLARIVSQEPRLLRVRGSALTGPKLRDRTAGSLGVYDYRPPATLFEMQVTALLDREGAETACRGRLLVRVEGTDVRLRAGDGIDAAGLARAPGEPMNPGDFDYQSYARSVGQAGVLVVEGRGMLTIRAGDGPWWGRLIAWRDELRRRAGGWILSNLPDTTGISGTPGAQRDAFVAAMLLGEREPSLDGLDETFRRVGLAHLLAISGLHLGIFAGFVLLGVRAGGSHRRWHGWLLIAVVAVYLILVEARMPVLRAGVMSLAGALAVAMGRRLRASGLVAMSAMALLLWRPEQLFNAGFQLTFGVVLGLIHLSPVFRERWFGAPDQLAGSTKRMIGQAAATATAVTITAWLIATPIQMAHFGTISPLGVPLTLLAIPLVTALLIVGYAKLALAMVLPSAAMLLAGVLAVVAESIIALVRLGDTLPGAAVSVPFAPAAWAIAAEAWVVGWAIQRSSRQRQWLQAAAAGLMIWLIWPLIPLGKQPAMRIDMIYVNDGSCYVIRAGGGTVVFDAGASPDLNAGRRSIVPALRRLGVRSIDAIIISHAHLDHFSSVLELTDAFGCAEAIVTPQFVESTEDDPHGPAAAMLAGLENRGVKIAKAAAGERRRFGGAALQWLHPPGDERFQRANDESAVVLMEAAGRRVLFCGDILSQAIGRLAREHPDLRADVMELPHHGAYTEDAAAFVRALEPSLVLQSTGARRVRDDRWPAALGGTAPRLLSVRDGASWVKIMPDGSIRAGSHLNGPLALLPPRERAPAGGG